MKEKIGLDTLTKKTKVLYNLQKFRTTGLRYLTIAIIDTSLDRLLV